MAPPEQGAGGQGAGDTGQIGCRRQGVCGNVQGVEGGGRRAGGMGGGMGRGQAGGRQGAGRGQGTLSSYFRRFSDQGWIRVATPIPF